MTFPANVMSLAAAAGSNFLNTAFGGVTAMSTGLNTMISHIVAAEKKIGTGSVTAPARGQGLVATGTADGDGNQGSTWDRFARKNLLYNGTFRVNQRVSAIGTTDNTYIHDRWRLLLEAANAAAAATEGTDVPAATIGGGHYALKLTVGSGEDNKFGVFQVLESADVLHLRGRTISLQAKLKATAAITDVRMAVLEFTGTADAVSGDPISSWGSAGTNPTLAANWAYLGTPANLSPTTSWAAYYVEGLTVGASMTNLAVMVWCEDETTTVTTDIMRVTDVQLEQGSVCTDVERPSFAEELAVCERYYTKTFPYVTTPAQNSGFAGNALRYSVVVAAANANSVVWQFPRRMRTSPTVTTYNPSAANTNWRNFSDTADSGASAAVGTNDARVQITNAQAAGDGVGESLGIHAQADAEL